MLFRSSPCLLSPAPPHLFLSFVLSHPLSSAPPFLPLQVREIIDNYKVGAPARVGLVAPNDVTIPGGNTGMDPSQTSFFQVGGRLAGAGAGGCWRGWGWEAGVAAGIVSEVSLICAAVGGLGQMFPSHPQFSHPQVLNIPTKINKGSVEITADVHLIKAGEKVGGWVGVPHTAWP